MGSDLKAPPFVAGIPAATRPMVQQASDPGAATKLPALVHVAAKGQYFSVAGDYDDLPRGCVDLWSTAFHHGAARPPLEGVGSERRRASSESTVDSPAQLRSMTQLAAYLKTIRQISRKQSCRSGCQSLPFAAIGRRRGFGRLPEPTWLSRRAAARRGSAPDCAMRRRRR